MDKGPRVQDQLILADSVESRRDGSGEQQQQQQQQREQEVVVEEQQQQEQRYPLKIR